jgi:hypothetical protein
MNHLDSPSCDIAEHQDSQGALYLVRGHRLGSDVTPEGECRNLRLKLSENSWDVIEGDTIGEMWLSFLL